MLSTANRHLTFDCSLLENSLLLHSYPLQSLRCGSAEVWLSRRLRVNAQSTGERINLQLLKHFCGETGENGKRHKPNMKLWHTHSFFPLIFCLYLWCRRSPPPPSPAALCLSGPPTHSAGPARATGWLVDCWGRGLPGKMRGPSGAEGAEDDQDGGTSWRSWTFSPG